MTTAAEKKAASEKAAEEKTAAEKFATDQAAIAERFKTKRKLVMPLLKMQTNVPIYVKPLSPHFTGKDISKKETDEKKKRNPAELCNVVDLVSGEEVQIIVSAVVLSVWEDEYPNDGYVGKGFKITKGKKGEGKSYFSYSVDEIELTE